MQMFTVDCPNNKADVNHTVMNKMKLGADGHLALQKDIILMEVALI